MVKQLLKKILPNPLKGQYYIGFVNKDKIKTDDNCWYKNVHWVNSSKYDKEGWFADPFFCEVSDTYILLLAEEMLYKNKRGRLVKLKIRRKDFFLEDLKPILTLDTHLSYPIIWRENKKTYVFPENQQSGKLYIYEYDLNSDSLINPKEILSERLLDSQLLKIDSHYYLLGVKFITGLWEETRYLQIYKADNLFGPYSFFQTIENKFNEERGGGSIIPIGNGRFLRPAQNCSDSYGKEIIMYEMTFDNVMFSERELYRISPNPTCPKGEVLHTYNECDGLCVIDGFMHSYPFLYKLLKFLRPNIQM